MGDLNKLDRQPPSPIRAWLLLATYLALIAARAWTVFDAGHTAAGITFLAIFAGIPAVITAVVFARGRRGTTPKPRTPAQQRRAGAQVALGGFAVIGALAVVNAKPGDRLATGIVVGVALALVALLALPGS